jgi:hypothetical protein
MFDRVGSLAPKPTNENKKTIGSKKNDQTIGTADF